MRIANNIMAMNTHRSYTTNNDRVATSAEKLSSGYRINKAGDDAAGLAISEKMRSQIRGLNMAVRNSQDAISLIQTAEGALQEVHSILQRMNELAVQSATGTNEEFDREQITKEFEQLKREINDISDQTTFNNMKLLDGSLSNEGVKRSAETTGIFVDNYETKADATMTTTFKGAEPEILAASASVKFTITEDNIDVTNANQITIDFKVGGTAINQVQIPNLTGSTITDIADLAGLLDGKSFTYDFGSGLQTGTISANPTTGEVEFVFPTGALDVSNVTDLELDFLGTKYDTGGLKTKNGVDYEAAKPAQTEVSFGTYEMEGLKVGDVLTINNQKYELVADAADTPSTQGATAIVWDPAQTDYADFAAKLAAASGFIVTDNGADGFTVAQSTYGEGDVAVYLTQAPFMNGSVEIDPAKLQSGDQLTVTITDKYGQEQSMTYLHNEGNTMQDILERFKTEFDGFSNVELKGNTLLFDAGAAEIDFVPQPTENYGTMRIQVGALENEQVSIEVKAMNTAGLELDDADISNQDAAGEAITKVRDAVSKVSDQRALLGASQNRMEHKINNLKVSAENLQAAESRIRDVDIAQEMTEFTKANILSQAATAMLAQANSAPQNVLSLLQ